MLRYFFIVLCFLPLLTIGQLPFFEQDSVPNKSRIIGSSIGIGAAWGGSIATLASVWYKDSWGDGFQFFNDGKEWLQMDKIGHAYAGYQIQRNVADLFRWSGFSRTKSTILGGAVSFGYLASFEVLDGFSDDWGFSIWDIAANTAGVLLYSAQELLWEEQRIGFKFLATPSPFAKYRPALLGSNFAERLLKDYNGQTYWLNFTPGAFFESNFPNWLSFSVGYSIQEKLHGFKDEFTVVFEGKDLSFSAYREYMFSLDIDFQRIKTDRPVLKMVFSLLNHVKVPIPAVSYSKHGFRVGY
jgi:hypothetical protein